MGRVSPLLPSASLSRQDTIPGLDLAETLHEGWVRVHKIDYVMVCHLVEVGRGVEVVAVVATVFGTQGHVSGPPPFSVTIDSFMTGYTRLFM